MRFKVNGRSLFARGASVIPLEELESRNDGDAIRRMVEWAAEANMNMLRLWGGGVYQFFEFYDACDELGIMVYHDLMFTDLAINNQSGHYFTRTHTDNLKDEIQYQILRLSQHPSIVLWDSCNECMLFGHYDDWAINVVASVDTSRPVWPSSPSYGWMSGVDRITGRPIQSQPLVSKAYDSQIRPIEYHGYYMAGNGFKTIVGDPHLQLFDPLIPPTIVKNTTIGPNFPGLFVSEFGTVTSGSFESLYNSLPNSNWSVHSYYMYQRNWPVDNIIKTYWGVSQDLDKTGELYFRKQLYQAQISQALYMQSRILAHRSLNEWGLLVWQLNEIWPTLGSWGSMDYNITRYRPLHYFYRDFLFKDVVVGCGAKDCFLKYDGTEEPLVGTSVYIEFIDLTKSVVVSNYSVAIPILPPRTASTYWFEAPPVPQGDPGTFVLKISAIVGTSVQCSYVALLTTPAKMKLPTVDVKVSVGRDHVVVTSDGLALYVTLSTTTPGYFVENVFMLMPYETKTVSFVFAYPGDILNNCKVIHMQAAMT